jgi:Xaa-Pro dipeptidase
MSAATARPRISSAEHRERQARLREQADARGWSGVAVLGRGGGTYDRHGDLMYLTGHYQSFVHLPDRVPLWSGRSHALLILPVDGPSILLCSAPESDPELAADDVRIARDFRTEAAALIEAMGPGAFSGFDVAPVAFGLPVGGLEPAEPVVERLRRRKSPAEQDLLRHACRVGTEAVDALMTHATDGATEGEAVAAAGEVILGAGGAMYATTLAVADRADGFTGRPLPGFRAERRFSAGEVARLDLAWVYEGYYCDFGRSWVVGGSERNPAAAAVIAELRQGLDAAVAAARAGAPAGAIARHGQAALGPGVETAYPPHWGHGLGMGWEGPYLLADNEEPLEPGFALAIETVVRKDGIAAGGEYDVLVGEDGPEILTPAGWP